MQDVMDNELLLSIIIPVYNVEQYLRRCLESVLNQVYKNLDIILIDDGSTDSSGNICEEYQRTDDRISVIHKKNSGLADARNTGLLVARGELIGFVDSDDWIEHDMYESMTAKYFETHSDIIACGYYSCTETKTTKYIWNRNIDTSKILTPLEALDFLLKNGMFNVAWNKIYTKTLFANLFFPSGKICEDSYIMYRLLLKANKIYLIDECKYYYFNRGGSIINSITSKRFIDEFYAYYTRHIYLKNNPDVTPQTIRLSLYTVGDCLTRIIKYFPFHIYKRNEMGKLLRKYFGENRAEIKEFCKRTDISKMEKILLLSPVFFIPLFSVFIKIQKMIKLHV
jgi:glycosyltransferase involved in cell wall biosynthesis